MTKNYLYARGSGDKGDMVIAELEKRGGKNVCKLKGEKEDSLYYLNPKTGFIGFTKDGSETSKILLAVGEALVITPAVRFSPGDKVRYQGKEYTVSKILEYRGKTCYSLKGRAGILSPEHLELIAAYEENEGVAIGMALSPAKGVMDIATGNEERMKKIVLSAAAQGQIADLIDEYGGWVPLGEEAFIVSPFDKGGKINFAVVWDRFLGGMLRFHEKDGARKFIEDHVEEVRDYLMCGE